METKDWFLFAISFGALFFSALNYFRTRSLENQNHIFKIKIDAYNLIVKELNALVNQLQSSFNLMETFIKDPTQKDVEVLHQKSLDYDDACLKFDDLLIQNSLLFPKNVMYHLDQLSNKILRTELPETDELVGNEKLVQDLEKELNELIIMANNLVAVFRKDMNSDRLNKDLFKRIENKFFWR